MTKEINVGNVVLGNGRIVVQTMTDTKTEDTDATLRQIEEVSRAGAELVRVSVYNDEAAKSFRQLVLKSPVPLIADVHFDGRLAVKALDAGAAKIRINPANLPANHFDSVVDAAKQNGAAIRIGVNRGSNFDKAKTVEELVDSCLNTAKQFEEKGFERLVLCIKSSDVRVTVAANRLLKQKTEYPIHVGLTEAGTEISGLMKSSAAIGSLLLDGIGDTIRISLTDSPLKEVYYARRLLNYLGLRRDMAEIISCPTCGRTEFDVKGTAKKMEELAFDADIPVKIAVMGCVVNGVGESKNADFGVAGGKNVSVIFQKGKIVKHVPNESVLEELKKLLEEAKENARG